MKARTLWVLVFIAGIICGETWAQGPNTWYYYNPATELSWASCYVYQDGGSKQKIPFLPAVNRDYHRAPYGTQKYSKDVDVKGTVVFIGNGIVLNDSLDCYFGRRGDYSLGGIDVSGKIVMFCYDFPDSVEMRLKELIALERRITEAASRGASAVVLFSYQEEYPFIFINYEKESDIPDIPVITITKHSAICILESAGRDGTVLTRWLETGNTPESEELISKMALKIKGNFDKVETDHFILRFRKEVISEDEVKELIRVNEKSVRFLLECFKADPETAWEKRLCVYFRDYDSKLFYTHHWGKGAAGPVGSFLVYDGDIPDYGLAVHENTHLLNYLSWGGSTSFMFEGIAKYTEALATDKDKNHLQTILFLKEGKLFPLEEMVTFKIGKAGLETEVGYPASGSFIHFLVESYGVSSLKEAFKLERRRKEVKEKKSTWERAYGKLLSELEEDWLYWLAKRYTVDEKYIQSFIKR